MNPQIIAFYLPQFHPTDNNNKWWGEGFTEWTNVAKAKKLYPGHYQPKVPKDLGFYDLRLPSVRKKQAELAKEAGITGFCYYHYWFENGREELDLPFKEVVNQGNPDFPFCLCWANESWYRKFWNSDGKVSDKKDLAIQKYLGEKDNELHFYSLLHAFKDKRYIKINGQLLFMIYKPLEFKGISEFISQWNDLAEKNKLPGFYFVGYSTNIDTEYDFIMKAGFQGACSCRIGYGKQSIIAKYLRKIMNLLLGIPRIFSYKKISCQFIQNFEQEHDNVYPTLIPNWDHTPRSVKYGYVYHNATPQLFKKSAKQILEAVRNKKTKDQLCFLKSWNEWGEGNYMEPDLKFGKGFINALHEAKTEVFEDQI